MCKVDPPFSTRRRNPRDYLHAGAPKTTSVDLDSTLLTQRFLTRAAIRPARVLVASRSRHRSQTAEGGHRILARLR